MVSQLWARAGLLAAALRLAAGQTQSACDPTLDGTSCKPNTPFGGQWSYDFTPKSSLNDISADWNIDDGIKWGKPSELSFSAGGGANFIINAVDSGTAPQAPRINTTRYMFFGKLDVVMKPARGAGIVSSIVLQSDDRDEIDIEFVGSKEKEIQFNFYHKGDFTNSMNGKSVDLDYSLYDDFHTYTIEWTPAFIAWSIDGTVVYTATKGIPAGVWPQTPCQVQLGSWPAGDAAAQGTSDWAGGHVDWSKAPYVTQYRSIKLVDYSNGMDGATEYSYGDRSGDRASIKIAGGAAKDMPASPGGAWTGGNSAPPSKSTVTTTSSSSSSSTTSSSSSSSSSTTSLLTVTTITSATAIPTHKPTHNATTPSTSAPTPTAKPAAPNAGVRTTAGSLMGLSLLALLAVL